MYTRTFYNGGERGSVPSIDKISSLMPGTHIYMCQWIWSFLVQVMVCHWQLDPAKQNLVKFWRLWNNALIVLRSYVNQSSSLRSTMLIDMVLNDRIMFVYSDRFRYGGGVSIFVQNSVECLVRTDHRYLNTHIETIFIEIDKNKYKFGKDTNLFFGVIYGPTFTYVKIFGECVLKLLDKNAAILKLVVWLEINKLSLNPNKFHSIIFKKPWQNISFQCELFCDNIKIKMKTHTKI